uniref:Uncharacterized protein n=1 Tax=Oryza meridionalis TaxID=40149 RepID=A0A0E0FEQ5_9ORYZ
MGADEHVRRGAAAAGERAAGRRQRALRARLRVVRAAARLPGGVRLPHRLPPQLRRRLRRPGPARPRPLQAGAGAGGVAGAVAQGRAVVRGGPVARRVRRRRRAVLPEVPGAVPAAVLRGRALPADGAVHRGGGADREPERDVGGLVARRRAPGDVRRRGRRRGVGEEGGGGAEVPVQRAAVGGVLPLREEVGAKRAAPAARAPANAARLLDNFFLLLSSVPYTYCTSPTQMPTLYDVYSHHRNFLSSNI